MVSYVYSKDEHHMDKMISAGETVRKITAATAKIRSLFEAGVPFYTKEAIRNVLQQLERSGEKGQKVSVRGLDGVIVDFEIETGITLPADQPDLEFIVCVQRSTWHSCRKTTWSSKSVQTTDDPTAERRLFVMSPLSNLPQACTISFLAQRIVTSGSHIV